MKNIEAQSHKQAMFETLNEQATFVTIEHRYEQICSADTTKNF